MAIITGVKFRTPGKVYYFAPGDLNPRYNDHVIVETARGVEYGTIVLPVREVPDEEIRQPLKEVMRIATPEDEAHEKENREREEEAYHICAKKIRDHELEMKLVSAEYTFDNSKLIFYFTADGRVDFRELVKDLAGVFRTRIELRQIGVRDETKIIGGIGICGRPLCCHAYLHEFAPVSIKMAKEQNLSLNPGKISGSCGRLMCCLKNEAETYEYLNRGLPRKGDGATTPDGCAAEVQSVNILRQTVRVIVYLENDEKEMREYPVSEISFVPKKGRKKPEDLPEQEEPENEEENLRILEEEVQADLSDELKMPAEDPEEEPKESRNRRKKNRRKPQNRPADAENKAAGGDGERKTAAKEGEPEKKTGNSGRTRRDRFPKKRKDGNAADGRKQQAEGGREAGAAANQAGGAGTNAAGEKNAGQSANRRHRRHRPRGRKPGGNSAPAQNEGNA